MDYVYVCVRVHMSMSYHRKTKRASLMARPRVKFLSSPSSSKLAVL